MIIDSHTHLAKTGERVVTKEDLIASMDEAGIDYSLVIANKTGRERGMTTDELVEISEQEPRLKAVGNLEVSSYSEHQLEHLFDLLSQKKIVGIKLYPGYEDYYPTDERLFPLYKFCQENNKPVIFHTGSLLIGLPGILKQVHPLNIDEVANKFPNLKIVMAHFGNPWVMDAAAVMYKNQNVYTDLSGFFTEYHNLSENEIKSFLSNLGQFKDYVGDFKKCLFGTDYPLYSQKEYLEAIEKLSLGEEEAEVVYWKNAKEIFNLKV